MIEYVAVCALMIAGLMLIRQGPAEAQTHLRATRCMILLSTGSLTFSAAFEAESHLTRRSCLSGHSLPLALYLKREDAHFTLDRSPAFQALLVGE